MPTPTPPTELGRNVIIRPGQLPPDVWSHAPQLQITAADATNVSRLSQLVERLTVAWATRTATVLMVDHDVAFPRDEATTLDPWLLPDDFTFLGERARWLAAVNSYDATDGDPTWPHIRHALTRGARPSHRADVALPDGTHVWLDGGPRSTRPTVPTVHIDQLAGDRPLTVERWAPSSDGLAADQRAAVEADEYACRIISPAGSGKTRVLTARLRHLLDGRGWHPQQVTALAYNNRAAAEMRDRTRDLDANVRTIHSLGYAIVRDAVPDVRMLDERGQRDLLARLAPVRPTANTDVYAPYLDGFSRVRLGLVAPDTIEDATDDVPEFARVLHRYRAELSARDLIDFDEQVHMALRVLLTDPQRRRRWQHSCTHLLVDEAQDLTPAFWLLVRLLAAPQMQVHAVGDDDQTLYAYVGASPKYLVDYPKLFPAAGSHALEVNYRCPPAVVDAAIHLLGRIAPTGRVAKTIRGARSDRDADALTIARVDATDQARYVTDRITGLLDRDVAPGDVAVLCRVNALLLPVQVALSAAGIPHTAPVGPQVLSRTGVAAALAWLRAATAGHTIPGDALAEAAKRSSAKVRGEHLRTLASRTWTERALRQLSKDVGGWDATQLVDFFQQLRDVRVAARVSTATALAAVRDVGGLDATADELDKSVSAGRQSNSHLDELDALTQVADLHPDAATFVDWLSDQLDARADPDGVRLATVHTTKGMEFAHVFVYAANDGIVPHRLVDDMDEERRVFHVAITRGTTSVDVVASKAATSPFAFELRPPSKTDPRPTPDSGRAARRGGAATRRATTPRRPGPTVVASVGDRITASGGISGEIVEISDDGVSIALRSGGRLSVGYGSKVTGSDGRLGTLTAS